MIEPSYIFFIVVLILAFSLLLYNAHAANRKFKADAGLNIVEFSPVLKAVPLGCAAVIVMMVWHFSYTEMSQSKGYVALLVVTFCFAVYSFAVFVQTMRFVCKWNDELIVGPDLVGRKVSIRWSDVSEVSFCNGWQVLKIKSNNGKMIWLSPMMDGLDRLSDELPSRAKENGFSLTLQPIHSEKVEFRALESKKNSTE